MKRFQPVNYNEDKDSIFVYVAPKPRETEDQMVLYTSVNNNYKYACFWSNNWRKVHRYPLLRKKTKKLAFYVKPELQSVESTKNIRSAVAEVDEILNEIGYFK
jgi:hypothetical protein